MQSVIIMLAEMQYQMLVYGLVLVLQLKIDRYGFFGADTDISAIHGPIAGNWYFQHFYVLFSASWSKI